MCKAIRPRTPNLTFVLRSMPELGGPYELDQKDWGKELPYSTRKMCIVSEEEQLEGRTLNLREGFANPVQSVD